MNPDELFEQWYNTEGVRFWAPGGHQEYLRHAFLSGLEVFRNELNKEKYQNDLWQRGAKIYEGHEEALGNWKMVSDKLLRALKSGDERETWEANEVYEWAKDRDIEINKEINDI